MEKPINVGDLVAVVRWLDPCAPGEVLWVFRVLEIVEGAQCHECGTNYAEPTAIGRRLEDTNLGYPVAWLKRIDPLTDEERWREQIDIAFEIDLRISAP